VPNIIREPKVLQKTGMSHSTMWKKINDGKFPAPVKLDPDGRASGWVDSEIDAVIDAAIKRRDDKALAEAAEPAAA
jgi:prophage regulatory protein